MAGWLTRAASAFGRHSKPPPQAFDLPCDCGERMSGWRTSSHQKLNCTQCDRPILVLPADVYPAVKRSSPVKSIQNPPAVVQPEARPGKSSSKSASKSGTAGKGTKDAATKPGSTAAAEERISLSPMLQQGRARRRSLRLVAVCILALLAVTGWSLRNRALREQARTAIPDATERGMSALHGGEFSRAVEELRIATQALDILHRHDPAAMTIRQAHREAQAAHGLASKGIVDLADEFLKIPGTFEERQQRFQADYGVQWLIFDVGVVNQADHDQQTPQFDVPLSTAEGRAVQVICDFPELRKRLQHHHSETPLRMIFAAQLDRWEETKGSVSLVARIKPKTAFLWSDYESYQAVGFMPADKESEDEAETRAVLNRQRQQEPTP